MISCDIIEAINYVQESRYTHEQWLRWLIKASDCGCQSCQDWIENSIPFAGDAEHHRKCIEKYDHVLSVLRRIL